MYGIRSRPTTCWATGESLQMQVGTRMAHRMGPPKHSRCWVPLQEPREDILDVLPCREELYHLTRAVMKHLFLA